MPVAAARTLTRPTLFDGGRDELPSSMSARYPRSLLVVCTAVLTLGCTTTVTGNPVASAPGLEESRSPVDADAVLLEQSRMRAITGGGDDLTVIPTMDGTSPVDL